MTRSREHLYRMIEDYMTHGMFDPGGKWRHERPEDLVGRAMVIIRAGLGPALDGAAVSDAIETIRQAAERELTIQLDGRGSWYRLVESDPPSKHETQTLAPTESI